MWRVVMLLCMCMCGIVLILMQRRRQRRRDIKFPPGPFAWPVIGHLRLFSQDLPHQALTRLSKKYGPVIALCLGQRRAVVVSSPELAKEVLLSHDKLFAHRPSLQFHSILLFGPSNSIFFNQGPLWMKNRKICMLRLFTAKRLQELQCVRQQEVSALLLSILHQSSAGTTTVDLGRCVGRMSSRLIVRLLHSRTTIEVGGENLQQLIRDAEQAMLPTMGDFIPSFSFLDIFKKQHMRRIHARLDKVFTEMLMERKESTSLDQDNDLLHALLSEEESFTVLEIKGILLDMLGAGIHTTALTIEWAMAELLRNPDCLHRLQREIDTQLGEKRQISDEDLPKLSYLKCVIKETSRLHPVLPLLTPHVSTEDCKLQGYTIPANTLMYVNVWAIGRDERVWPNANKFMPERFEGKDIDLKGQHFELLPFGSGRRICLGLNLALPLIEVTLANLVSCFQWELPYGETPKSINMDEKSGFTANRATPIMAIPKPQVLSLFSNLPNI